MSDEYRSSDFERLEPPLQAAVQAALAEPIPEDAVDRVKSRARQLAAVAAATSPVLGSRHRGRITSRPLIAALTAAAALLVMAAAALLLLNHSGTRAFAQMVEKVKAASSVQFTTSIRFGRRPAIDGVMYIEGNRIRLEQFDGMLIEVGDITRKQALSLDMLHKVARADRIGVDVAQGLANPIDQLRRAKSDDAKQIGEEILKGRRTRVYRLSKADLLDFKGFAEILVWIDVESELPAKIVLRNPDPKDETEIRLDKFVWNESLDARLFSLAVPDGFQKRVAPKTPKPLQEPMKPKTTCTDNPDYLADGVLSRNRVPARIDWDPQGKTITALMRDPELVPALEQKENELRQWDVPTGKLRWSKMINGADWLAGTGDGKTLAIVIGYEMQLRDAATGRITKKWATDEHLSPLAFSPDGTTLAAGITEWGPHGGKGGKESGGVQFWDVERAALVRSISDDEPTTFIRYSLDGKHLATSSNAGPVKLWDVATGKLARIFPARSKADFSPDGKTIACVSQAPRDDKTIGRVDLYDLQKGSLVKSFASEKGASASWLLCVAFSPNGRLLAASDWNGTVTLWDATTGAHKQTIADHQGGVHWAVFAPDGATLATGSEDKTLRLRKLPAELIQPALKKR
jgi:hypothetical protein